MHALLGVGQRLVEAEGLNEAALAGVGAPSAPAPAAARPARRSAWAALAALITPPAAWLILVYLASLVLLVVASLFTLDPRSQRPTTELTTANLRQAFTVWQWVEVVLRSAGVALAVTLISIAVAVPVGFFIARVAPRWSRRALIVSCLLPLWAGYLVKAYAWRAMLRPATKFGVDKGGGLLASVFGWTPGSGWLAVVLALTYLWLPYMILPVYTGIERLPSNLLEASSDLGARPLRTFVSVVSPALVPAIAAGSIFAFSLSFGDYIIPGVVSNGKVMMIGNLIAQTLLAPNQPLAAAFTLWPLVIIVAYLLVVRRVGGMDAD